MSIVRDITFNINNNYDVAEKFVITNVNDKETIYVHKHADKWYLKNLICMNRHIKMGNTPVALLLSVKKT